MTERFQALKDARAKKPGHGHVSDFMYSDEPVCPHCGREISVSEHELWQLYDDNSHDMTCPYCDLEFTVQSIPRYRFSTDEQWDEDDE